MSVTERGEQDRKQQARATLIRAAVSGARGATKKAGDDGVKDEMNTGRERLHGAKKNGLRP